MDFQILDMAGARPEHSAVNVNFVATVRGQLLNSTCYVFSDNVQYRWHTKDGDEKAVVPDASINCRAKARKGNVFLDIPRFVMEVLSPSTENYDRGDKKELYRQQEIDEYWIVDWQKKEVEIYNLDYDENGEPQYYLWNKFTERNKEELKIVHFPNLSITFDQLFAEVDMEY
ncbi:Uma2 family endonuclease [Lachnospiraceae bacterium 47-T17]